MKNQRITHIGIEMPGREMLDFLSNYELGTPGKLRYRHTGIDAKIKAMDPIPFLVLRRDGQIRGLIGFAFRMVQQAGVSVPAFNIRYFSIASPFQSTGQHSPAGKSRGHDRGGMLKRYAGRIFDNPWMLLGKEGNDPAFCYAFIEDENRRSSGLGETMGFLPVRYFYTLLYSRLFPGNDPGVTGVKPEERDEVLEKVHSFYRNHNFFTPQNLFYRDDYFVYRRDGKIVAGLQANTEKWIICDMPGPDGFLFTQVFPHIPVFRKLIGKQSMKFLALEGIWSEPGHENDILKIMESVMNRRKIFMALTWMDADGPLYRMLKKTGKRGFVGSFLKPVKARVVIRPSAGFDQGLETMKTRPAYISCLDMT
ncbi:MAG: hypothetical protein ACP5D1_09060 [Bacteroidales bacterium]